MVDFSNISANEWEHYHFWIWKWIFAPWELNYILSQRDQRKTIFHLNKNTLVIAFSTSASRKVEKNVFEKEKVEWPLLAPQRKSNVNVFLCSRELFAAFCSSCVERRTKVYDEFKLIRCFSFWVFSFFRQKWKKYVERLTGKYSDAGTSAHTHTHRANIQRAVAVYFRTHKFNTRHIHCVQRDKGYSDGRTTAKNAQNGTRKNGRRKKKLIHSDNLLAEVSLIASMACTYSSKNFRSSEHNTK